MKRRKLMQIPAGGAPAVVADNPLSGADHRRLKMRVAVQQTIEI